MADGPLVSIVIVNWNGWHFLPACLDSLARQSYSDHEILMIDNASEDGSVERVRKEYPHVRIVENRVNVGFAIANNQALDHCRGSGPGPGCWRWRSRRRLGSRRFGR